MRALLVAVALLLPVAVCAQQKPAPVQDAGEDREATLQRAQMRASAAYGELREAQYQLKLAEQEVWAAQDAARAGEPDPAQAKRRVSAADKALQTAKAREAAARAAYDKSLDAVEALRRR